jgi:hypothetical protein
MFIKFPQGSSRPRMGRLATALASVVGLLLLAAALVSTACGDDSPDDGARSVASQPAPEPEPEPEPEAEPEPQPQPEPEHEPAATLPADLVGTWIAAEGGAELVYVFAADGSYKHAGVLLQQREAGTFSFTISASGMVEADRSTLLITPQSGTQEIKDPDAPGSASEEPIDTSPQRYEWALDASGPAPELRLTDADGLTLTYVKQ